MKIDYRATFSIDIAEPSLKALTQAYFQLSRILLSDFFQNVLRRFAEHFMELETKPCKCQVNFPGYRKINFPVLLLRNTHLLPKGGSDRR